LNLPQLWKSTKVAFGDFFLMISTSRLKSFRTKRFSFFTVPTGPTTRNHHPPPSAEETKTETALTQNAGQIRSNALLKIRVFLRLVAIHRSFRFSTEVSDLLQKN